MMRWIKAWYERKRCRWHMAADDLARMYLRAYGTGSSWADQSRSD